ncbi:MAG: HNH endonuclease [Phycisphaerales bacterium]|nr:MAG: HNH endonuclease [Phycisphaerales bacterium]
MPRDVCYNPIMSEARRQCPVCGRMVLPANMTRHHVVPKSRGGNEIEHICKTCHRQVHALFGNKELAGTLHSLPELRAHPEMRKYIAWVRKQNPDRYYRGRPARNRKE